MSNILGERLRELRKEKNLLQSEFGNVFGLSPSAVGSYERGEREASYKQLVEFADYFGVSMDYLLGRADERLTVEDYTSQDTFQFAEFLKDKTILVGSYELTDTDKKNIYNISRALLFGFDSEEL